MNFTADTCLKNGTCNQKCDQGRTCPRLAGAQRVTPMPTKVITLSTPTGSVVHPYTGQAPYKPPPKPNITGLLSSRETLGPPIVGRATNVRPIHPHLHAQPDAWLTTPGQLERTEDERTGRVDTMLELGAKIIIWLVGTVIFAILAIAFTVQYGDTIANFIWQTLQAWGRVWT